MEADGLFRLEPDDQLVRLRRRAARGEDRVRHVLELNKDLGVAGRHALAGAQVERDALPPPIVDVRLQGDEGLGLALVADFLGVARHRFSVDRAPGILSGDDMRLDVVGRDWP